MSFYSEFALYYEQVFPFREEVYAFLKGYAGEPGAAVLDIGCGTGHYCGRFARDGYACTGIDLDRGMVDAAARSYPQALFRLMDIADAGHLQGSFDMAYSIGNVLAHLPQSGFSRLLQAVHSRLRPEGSWIFQTVNWDRLLGFGEYRFPVKTMDGGAMTFHRLYSGISPEHAVFSFSLMKGDSALFSEQVSLYPATSGRYLELHDGAGFVHTGAYGGFDGVPFVAEQSSALVMVFRKKT
ncbi:MAG: class I SAM-dependent methyltransferase [Chlorobi bacterium]|nr:class I SAM-dependent methyltransferase [Chlorobiota bacterium]